MLLDEPPLSLVAPLLLIFCFADLGAELRGRMRRPKHPWNDRQHFTFVGVLSLFTAILLPIAFFLAVQAMIRPIVGSPG